VMYVDKADGGEAVFNTCYDPLDKLPLVLQYFLQSGEGSLWVTEGHKGQIKRILRPKANVQNWSHQSPPGNGSLL
jgi:hypothetical protein